MPLPLAEFNKLPVVFIDVLSPILADLHRAFDVRFVLTSNIVAGGTRDAMVKQLDMAGLITVAGNLDARWVTPYDADANLEDEIDAWHATACDRTPTAFLVITNKARGACLSHILTEYTVVLEAPHFTDEEYLNACRILHSQLTFEPFNPDYY